LSAPIAGHGSDALFIGVDWGTSNGRFMLIDVGGLVIEERRVPGIARLDGAVAIEAACFEAIADWPTLPVVMAGMVGANIGWKPAPYAAVPASCDDVFARAVRFEARGRAFAIVPGVRSDRPDVMRGEETQIFGAAQDGVICLPGTHAKWAMVESGAITTFHTAMTGELIEILGRHSILLNPQRAPAATVGDAFLDGVRTARNDGAGLEVLLFTVRSRQLADTLAGADADSYLTGLFIGADVRSALAIHMMEDVTVIGSQALIALYAAALDIFGIGSHKIDGQQAVVAGLARAHRTLFA
jgi:2-dehydro-3-deoxygalactonokinase